MFKYSNKHAICDRASVSSSFPFVIRQITHPTGCIFHSKWVRGEKVWYQILFVVFFLIYSPWATNCSSAWSDVFTPAALNKRLGSHPPSERSLWLPTSAVVQHLCVATRQRTAVSVWRLAMSHHLNLSVNEGIFPILLHFTLDSEKENLQKLFFFFFANRQRGAHRSCPLSVWHWVSFGCDGVKNNKSQVLIITPQSCGSIHFEESKCAPPNCGKRSPPPPTPNLHSSTPLHPPRLMWGLGRC